MPGYMQQQMQMQSMQRGQMQGRMMGPGSMSPGMHPNHQMMVRGPRPMPMQGKLEISYRFLNFWPSKALKLCFPLILQVQQITIQLK